MKIAPETKTLETRKKHWPNTRKPKKDEEQTSSDFSSLLIATLGILRRISLQAVKPVHQARPAGIGGHIAS